MHIESTKLTRRAALRMGIAGAGWAARAGFGAAAGGATAFALCGDESHNSDYIRAALTGTLVEEAGLSIDFTDEEKLLTYEKLKNYKILIMFRDGLRFPNGYYQAMYWTGKPADIVSVPPIEKKIGGKGIGWMTAEQGKAIKAWVREGGSLWAFHNNSQASLMNQDYRDVEGAIYTGASSDPAVQGPHRKPGASGYPRRQRFRGDRRAALCHLRQGSQVCTGRKY
jgi:hypothetical protein